MKIVNITLVANLVDIQGKIFEEILMKMAILELGDILDHFEDHQNLDQEISPTSLLTLVNVPEGHHVNNLLEKASKESHCLK